MVFFGKVLMGLVPGGKQLLAAGEQESLAIKAIEAAVGTLRGTQLDGLCSAALSEYDAAEKEMDGIDGDIPAEVADRHDFAVINLIKAVAASEVVPAEVKELFEQAREAKKKSLKLSFEAMKQTSPDEEELAKAKEHFDKEFAALEG